MVYHVCISRVNKESTMSWWVLSFEIKCPLWSWTLKEGWHSVVLTKFKFRRLWIYWDQVFGMFGITTHTRKSIYFKWDNIAFLPAACKLLIDLFLLQVVCWNGCMHCDRSIIHLREDALQRVPYLDLLLPFIVLILTCLVLWCAVWVNAAYLTWYPFSDIIG